MGGRLTGLGSLVVESGLSSLGASAGCGTWSQSGSAAVAHGFIALRHVGSSKTRGQIQSPDGQVDLLRAEPPGKSSASHFALYFVLSSKVVLLICIVCILLDGKLKSGHVTESSS